MTLANSDCDAGGPHSDRYKTASDLWYVTNGQAVVGPGGDDHRGEDQGLPTADKDDDEPGREDKRFG